MGMYLLTTLSRTTNCMPYQHATLSNFYIFCSCTKRSNPAPQHSTPDSLLQEGVLLAVAQTREAGASLFVDFVPAVAGTPRAWDAARVRRSVEAHVRVS